MANGLWFRLYVEVAHSRKIQDLPGDLFKTWVNLMCLAKANAGILPSIQDISWTLRIDTASAADRVNELISRRLVDETEAGLYMHDWDEHQFDSDSSTERVREWRKRQVATLRKKQGGTLQKRYVKQHETENETLERQSRTEQNREEHTPIFLDPKLPTTTVHLPPNGGAHRNGCNGWKEEKFEEFWSAVWSKTSKGTAKPAFLRKANTPEIADKIIQAARKQGPEILQRAMKGGITPVYPTTWLNGERWEDEVIEKPVYVSEYPER